MGNFSHQIIVEKLGTPFSNSPYEYIFKLDNAANTPLCVIPIPIGGIKNEKGENKYASEAKDELLKRWNNHQELVDTLQSIVDCVDNDPDGMVSRTRIKVVRELLSKINS